MYISLRVEKLDSRLFCLSLFGKTLFDIWHELTRDSIIHAAKIGPTRDQRQDYRNTLLEHPFLDRIVHSCIDWQLVPLLSITHMVTRHGLKSIVGLQ